MRRVLPLAGARCRQRFAQRFMPKNVGSKTNNQTYHPELFSSHTGRRTSNVLAHKRYHMLQRRRTRHVKLQKAVG